MAGTFNGRSDNFSAFIDWNRSLVGWWNFEYVDSDGTVYDNSSYGNNGIMNGFDDNTTKEGRKANRRTEAHIIK